MEPPKTRQGYHHNRITWVGNSDSIPDLPYDPHVLHVFSAVVKHKIFTKIIQVLKYNRAKTMSKLRVLPSLFRLCIGIEGNWWQHVWPLQPHINYVHCIVLNCTKIIWSHTWPGCDSIQWVLWKISNVMVQFWSPGLIFKAFSAAQHLTWNCAIQDSFSDLQNASTIDSHECMPFFDLNNVVRMLLL